MPWQATLIAPGKTVRDAIETIQNSGGQICLVAGDDRVLLGTITDGDVRRGLLNGLDLDTPVEKVMNKKPHSISPNADPAKVQALMKKDLLRQIPAVDEQGRVVGLYHINDFESGQISRNNWVVLMAGGLGTRLKPLTEDNPKPLLPVGDKPILETILEGFIEQNFRKFYISVNYKAAAIKVHFGNGEKWGVEIRYLEEKTRLGTAGALQLIPETPDHPLFVMNGDLLTRVNFQDLLEYHLGHDAKATMCVREYDLQVPFGVVDIKNNRIQDIDEKPLQRFFINAGIYVLDPDLIGLIPEGKQFDMTDLFGRAAEEGHSTAAFPIHEYWLDVGRIDDLEQANLEFDKNFAK
ncbi:MAG: CBS domain-containing protein [Rhodospirillales bacterium]|nr:CBS domain-containing protein [Rhodospirillales bacterium]